MMIIIVEEDAYKYNVKLLIIKEDIQQGNSTVMQLTKSLMMEI